MVVQYTPPIILVNAIRVCWDSKDKSDNFGPVDKALIKRVCLKHKHGSVMEHIKFVFDIFRLPDHEVFNLKTSNYLNMTGHYGVINLRYVIEHKDELETLVKWIKKTEYGFMFEELS